MLSIARIRRLWRRALGLPPDEHVILVKPWRVAYFRIPKAANTSVKTALAKSLALPTIPGLARTRDMYWRTVSPDAVDLVSKGDFVRAAAAESYWSFAVVREPMARVLSCYRNKIIRNTALSPPMIERGFRRDMSLEEFVRHACELPDEETDVHLQSQTSMLVHRGQVLPQLIVRMEELEAGWSAVRRQVLSHSGATLVKLRHSNRTDRVVDVPALGDELSRLIHHRYRDDYERFYSQAT